MFRLILFLFLLLSFNAFSQKFADKSYYLVDSLVYDNISPDYQSLIDNSLKGYHATNDDVQRVRWVNQIVKLCWDENVWPKYNQWICDFTTEQLKKPQSDTVRYQLLQAQAGSLYYIGWNYGLQTNYEKCINAYEQCKNIYIEIKDSIGIANSLDNIGGIFLLQGESAKALNYHMQSLAIREKIKNTLGIGAALNSIGSIYLENGDYKSALKEFKRSLSCFEQATFPSGKSSVLNNIGMIEVFFGEYQNALVNFNKSLEIKEQLGDKQGKAISLLQIGTVYIRSKEYSKALEHLIKSQELYREIGDKRGLASSYRSVGILYRLQGDNEKAIENFNQSLSIAKEVGASIEVRPALECLFETHVMQNNLDAAEKEILEIISTRIHDIDVNFPILAEQKKEIYLSTMAQDFKNLYAFAHLRHKNNPDITDIAYNNSLRLKGLLLKSGTAMREAILTSGDKKLIGKYQQWINLKIALSCQYANGGDTDSLEIIANELEKELIAMSTTFNDFNQQNLNWKQIQSTLKANEIAIEFVHFDADLKNETSADRYAALVISPVSKHPELVELCTSTELESIIGTSQANNINYIETIYGSTQQLKPELYNLVWKPLENKLKGSKTIYFSPTGLLHKISFAAMSNEKGSFLSNQFRLIQLNSTGQLIKNKPFKFDSKSSATLFGGVHYSSESTQRVIWNYLPGSLTEINAIHEKLKTNLAVNLYTEKNATEENLKKSVAHSKFIHIATHGFFYPDPESVQKITYKETTSSTISFRGTNSNYGIWNFVNNKNPLMRSGIALTGANDAWDRDVFAKGEDGVLTAQEVTTLNMRNTDLVVLSACETGLGDIKGNEGVYGLQRAFKIAGVRYLIISLWQVPDKETSEFMILFYSKLLAVKDIRKAFSETQNEMRKKYDPYFWAAFVLVE